ncbi:MAG: DUF2147 domain-containing protein [Pelagimonas sp.]|jgi:uncharacterized protein (DUF2147 family)|nr:DUF2147 domain-containing protein [Pelagimonas sp.]
MKKRVLLALALIFGTGLGAGMAAAEPIVGTWKTQPDDGSYAHVKIAPCGSAFCGVISKTFNDSGEYNSPNKGKKLVRDMKAKGGGAYEGKVWRPSNGKIYLGKAQISGSKMQLKGCVAGGLLCSKQTWTKIN